MSQHDSIGQAFVAFLVILGLALLWASIHTVLHLIRGDLHARIIGMIETVGESQIHEL
ncbi:MAG TPA: hypothetical protein VFX42_04550 [Gemmatimonadales bacterium]|nr:hypothetical protein [Gemmatimonadales bacterium]